MAPRRGCTGSAARCHDGHRWVCLEEGLGKGAGLLVLVPLEGYDPEQVLRVGEAEGVKVVGTPINDARQSRSASKTGSRDK